MPASARRPTALVVAALLAALLVGCGGADSGGGASVDPEAEAAQSDTAETIPFDREGRLAVVQDRDTLVVIDIEVADTDSARQRGMMQRSGFPNPTSGMLFPFEEEQQRGFWMANTPVALDILYADADSQIVSIAKYTTPFSSETVSSEGPAKFVLEVPAGFTDRHGVLEGDRLRWTRTDE
jgi:hypothetical protein